MSADQLVDALWNEQLTGSATKRVQVSIARLRKTLDTSGRGRAPALRTVAGGYLLDVRTGECDADVFRARLDAGRRALDSDDPARAAGELAEALELWRGPALADVAYEDWAQPEIRRLEELRRTALELRFEAALRLGEHAEVASELEALATDNPTRERLTGQLMVALYRCGRQADALEAYQRTRRHLATELGLEPGHALKALQAEILEQSAALELNAAEPAFGDRAPPRAHGSSDEAPPTATPDAATPKPDDARRFVSVLAVRADIEDPEVLHDLLDRCAGVIEQHGGTVERYLGNALAGFFGLTRSHGDDPLRATRAAVQLRLAAGELRLGIEAGEVFLGAGQRGPPVATGVTITTAGRLAERARPGEILIGDRIRPAVAAEASVDAASGRLLGLRAGEPALLRAPTTPFVGRERELATLCEELARVRDDCVCRLVTVVGAPGIGKSRLAGEFLAAAARDGATVLAGRCLSYGEGTTFHALADVVRGLGADPSRKVEELLAGDEQAVRGILGAAGFSAEPAQAEEIAWALRRLLERLARERTVVVAFEDIHWAQPTLLELLDHVAALSRGSPILLVCLTRPELLEARAQWAAPQPNRSLLVLDALDDADARELAQRLGAGAHVDRIVDRAEGNPLFVEQLVAVDAEQIEAELPASIQAVLAARIDHLEPAERALLQRAAVEGRTFHAGALTAGSPVDEQRAATAQLVALARKGLIGTDRPELAGEEAFRFTHSLIREAAYAAIPKLRRAQLHARVAEWLEARPEAADEVVGFHLEQACLLSAELGRSGERERGLGARGAARLQAASRGALARGDPILASALLERAVALVASDEAARAALLPALGASLFEAGRADAAAVVLDEAVEQAREPRLAARAQVERELVRLETATTAGFERPHGVVDAALPILEREGDHYGQARAWSLRAQLAWAAGQVGRADQAWCVAERCARRAGDARELFAIVGWRATAAVLGPTPVTEAIRRCEALGVLVGASPVASAWTITPLASLHAMRGAFELAERYLEDARQILSELGGLGSNVSHHEALVRLLAGRPELAEVPLRETAAELSATSSRGLFATTTAMLAQAVYAQGRTDEAAELCRESAEAADPEDIVTQVIWRGVHAKVLAGQGRCGEAEAMARAAVALVEPTDLLSHHGDALLDLAEVLAACGRAKDSHDAIRDGLSLYARKENTAAAQRARSLLPGKLQEAQT